MTSVGGGWGSDYSAYVLQLIAIAIAILPNDGRVVRSRLAAHRPGLGQELTGRKFVRG
jgi:hypothetical protein